jgi:hypothetical protein
MYVSLCPSFSLSPSTHTHTHTQQVALRSCTPIGIRLIGLCNILCYCKENKRSPSYVEWFETSKFLEKFVDSNSDQKTNRDSVFQTFFKFVYDTIELSPKRNLSGLYQLLSFANSETGHTKKITTSSIASIYRLLGYFEIFSFMRETKGFFKKCVVEELWEKFSHHCMSKLCRHGARDELCQETSYCDEFTTFTTLRWTNCMCHNYNNLTMNEFKEAAEKIGLSNENYDPLDFKKNPFLLVFSMMLECGNVISLSLSLSLARTHTHTHTHNNEQELILETYLNAKKRQQQREVLRLAGWSAVRKTCKLMGCGSSMSVLKRLSRLKKPILSCFFG